MFLKIQNVLIGFNFVTYASFAGSLELQQHEMEKVVITPQLEKRTRVFSPEETNTLDKILSRLAEIAKAPIYANPADGGILVLDIAQLRVIHGYINQLPVSEQILLKEAMVRHLETYLENDEQQIKQVVEYEKSKKNTGRALYAAGIALACSNTTKSLRVVTGASTLVFATIAELTSWFSPFSGTAKKVSHDNRMLIEAAIAQLNRDIEVTRVLIGPQ